METLNRGANIILLTTYPKIFSISAIYPLNSEKYRMRVTVW